MKAKLLIIALVSVLTSYGQELRMCGYQGYQTIEEVTSACDLQNASRSENNTEDAEAVVDAILDKVGLFRNFLIEECNNINNALAVTMPLEGGDLDRYILYDLEFFKKVSASTGTDWGLTSILAHEVGHHLNGHTLKSGGSNHKVELQADEFSGFVLARMKCSLEDAQSAVSNLLPDEASSTHPAKQDRLDAIAKGWNRGNGKTIKVKKIKEVKDENEITADMVLANYLDAIGGQEKVQSVKTLIKEYRITVPNFVNDAYHKIILASPNDQYRCSSVGKELYYEFINKEGYMYEKSIINGKGEWTVPTRMKSSEKMTSYFIELNNLVNRNKVKFMGIKNIDGVEYYAVEFPSIINTTTESLIFSENYINTHIRFYNLKTGLVEIEEIRHVKSKIYKSENLKSWNETETSFSMIEYSDYRNISGILFPFNEKYFVAKEENDLTTPLKVWRTLIYSSIEINPTIDPKLFETN